MTKQRIQIGDLLKYNARVPKEAQGMPMRATGPEDNTGTLLCEFLTTAGGRFSLSSRYWVSVHLVEPATQEDVDNWVLEQELTK